MLGDVYDRGGFVAVGGRLIAAAAYIRIRKAGVVVCSPVS